VMISAIHGSGMALAADPQGRFAYCMHRRHEASMWLCSTRHLVKPVDSCWKPLRLVAASTTRVVYQPTAA
jgi:hypothetical protein